jgi:hypothetical protein
MEIGKGRAWNGKTGGEVGLGVSPAHSELNTANNENEMQKKMK